MRKFLVRRSCGGFTVLEVLLSGVLLALVSAGVIGLIRLSEASAMRGRLDFQASTVFKDMFGRVLAYPMDSLREDLAGMAPDAFGVYEFTHPIGVGGSFPFLYPGEDPEESRYLYYGKALPGQASTDFRAAFPCTVRVTFSVPSGYGVSDAPYFDAVVTVEWTGYEDRLASGSSAGGALDGVSRQVSLTFQKWGGSGA